jgi:single-strand DNA-binding protein
MATNINRTELTGNLGNTPDQRFGANGTLVATASIAVHSRYRQGETWNERTDWFRLVAFGDAAEHLAHFTKGERITVTGRLQSSSYTDREGIRRGSVEVVVLRSEPAPLPKKAEAEPEAETDDAVEELPFADEAPVEATEPAPKAARPRRKKTAA